MICKACCDNRHDRCEDVVRYENYVTWLRATYGGTADHDGPVVGVAELAVIRANRPYASCPCHHKGSTVAETARGADDRADLGPPG